MANYVWNKLICGKDFFEKYYDGPVSRFSTK